MSQMLGSERRYIRAWQARAARIEMELLDKIRRKEPVSRNVEALHQERLSFGNGSRTGWPMPRGAGASSPASALFWASGSP